MRNAALAKAEKSLVLAGIQGNAIFPTAAKLMRRLFGSRGAAVRQDVAVAADMSLPPGSEGDHGAWLAYRKEKKKKEITRMEDGAAKKSRK